MNYILGLFASFTLFVSSLFGVATVAHQPVVSTNFATSTSKSMKAAPVKKAVESIAYKSVINAKPIRVIESNQSQNSRTDIYNAGLITEGPYKADVLALFVSSWQPVLSDPSRGISEYGYFISNGTGMPIAWDSSLVYGFYESGPEGEYSVAASYPARLAIIEKEIRVADSMRTTLSIVPPEFRYGSVIFTKDAQQSYRVGGITLGAFGDSQTTYIRKPEQVGTTNTGISIMKQQYNGSINQYRYYLQLPFGSTEELTPIQSK